MDVAVLVFATGRELMLEFTGIGLGVCVRCDIAEGVTVAGVAVVPRRGIGPKPEAAANAFDIIKGGRGAGDAGDANPVEMGFTAPDAWELAFA